MEDFTCDSTKRNFLSLVDKLLKSEPDHHFYDVYRKVKNTSKTILEFFSEKSKEEISDKELELSIVIEVNMKKLDKHFERFDKLSAFI